MTKRRKQNTNRLPNCILHLPSPPRGKGDEKGRGTPGFCHTNTLLLADGSYFQRSRFDQRILKGFLRFKATAEFLTTSSVCPRNGKRLPAGKRLCWQQHKQVIFVRVLCVGFCAFETSGFLGMREKQEESQSRLGLIDF